MDQGAQLHCEGGTALAQQTGCEISILRGHGDSLQLMADQNQRLGQFCSKQKAVQKTPEEKACSQHLCDSIYRYMFKLSLQIAVQQRLP